MGGSESTQSWPVGLEDLNSEEGVLNPMLRFEWQITRWALSKCGEQVVMRVTQSSMVQQLLSSTFIVAGGGVVGLTFAMLIDSIRQKPEELAKLKQAIQDCLFDQELMKFKGSIVSSINQVSNILPFVSDIAVKKQRIIQLEMQVDEQVCQMEEFMTARTQAWSLSEARMFEVWRLGFSLRLLLLGAQVELMVLDAEALVKQFDSFAQKLNRFHAFYMAFRKSMLDLVYRPLMLQKELKKGVYRAGAWHLTDKYTNRSYTNLIYNDTRKFLEIGIFEDLPDSEPKRGTREYFLQDYLRLVSTSSAGALSLEDVKI